MSRNDLKALVKECLVEILNEGLKNVVVKKQQKQRVIETKKPHVSSMIRPQHSADIKEAINRESCGDPVMAAILADTASTTLHKMIDGDRHVSIPGGNAVDDVVANHTPEELFGDEITSKWATLAFK